MILHSYGTILTHKETIFNIKNKPFCIINKLFRAIIYHFLMLLPVFSNILLYLLFSAYMAREFVARKYAYRMEKSARRLPQVGRKIKTGRTKIVLPDLCLDYNCAYIVPFKTPAFAVYKRCPTAESFPCKPPNFTLQKLSLSQKIPPCKPPNFAFHKFSLSQGISPCKSQRIFHSTHTCPIDIAIFQRIEGYSIVFTRSASSFRFLGRSLSPSLG